MNGSEVSHETSEITRGFCSCLYLNRVLIYTAFICSVLNPKATSMRMTHCMAKCLWTPDHHTRMWLFLKLLPQCLKHKIVQNVSAKLYRKEFPFLLRQIFHIDFSLYPTKFVSFDLEGIWLLAFWLSYTACQMSRKCYPERSFKTNILRRCLQRKVTLYEKLSVYYSSVTTRQRPPVSNTAMACTYVQCSLLTVSFCC